MVSALKLLLAVAATAIGFCVFVPAALARPAATPPPIGDGCLVGRWIETKETAPGNWAWNGQIVAVSGLQGMVITFTADGTETDYLSAALPLTANFNGHRLKIFLRGYAQFHVQAGGSSLVQTAPVDNVGVSYNYDGRPVQGGAVYLAGVYTYRCGPTTLHRETAAHTAGYGPLVDDLVRAPAAGASGGLASTVSSGLPTPAAVLAAPMTLLVSAVLALAAVLLITFPSQLFNRTYEENHEVIRYWWERRFGWLLRLRLRAFRRGTREGRASVGFLAVVLVGGLLAALLDPSFGFNLRTLALFMGAVCALLAGSIVSFAAAGVYRILRHKAGTWRLHALPSGLAIAAICVLVSRLTNFQPGYLYGLMGGIVFAHALTKNEEGHVVAVTSAVTLAVALAAWFVWVPVSIQSTAHPTDFGSALASNFLAAIFVSGMVGLLIGLVPLRFLPGEKLAGWHRGVWGTVFGMAALSVIEVMLRPESSAGRAAPAPFWVTAGLFVAFGVVSILFWGYFRVRRRPAAESLGAND